jgi:AmiR/NasT family two-component response regulator
MLRLRIIIGDNDNGFLVQAVTLLTQAGYDVVHSDTSGTSLLRKIRSLNPDVVIADATLKGLSGFEISDIVEGEGVCPCIITFKSSPEEYALKLQKKIIYAYIQKPLNIETLRYAIENAYFNFKKFIELDRKLKERKIIEKAKGLLMKKYNMSEDKAYEYLRRKSMDKCLPMHKVAAVLIDVIEKKESSI